MTAAIKSLAINVKEPGLFPLEQLPASEAKYGHIDIPKFGRHLLFSPSLDYDGRRVEWVPEWVARYMMDRFNRRQANFEIAHDLLQSKNVDSLKSQVRATLLAVVREPWFQHEVAAIARQAVGLPEPEPVVAGGQEPGTPTLPNPQLYVARSSQPLVSRKKAPKIDLTPEQLAEAAELEKTEE